MTSCFVCATLNLGRKKSTGTEPHVDPDTEVSACNLFRYEQNNSEIREYHVDPDTEVSAL